MAKLKLGNSMPAEDHESGGYLLHIESEVLRSDCVTDVISIDKDSNAIWFDSRISSILDAGWRDPEYIEIEQWIKDNFEGDQIGPSILGRIRRHMMNEHRNESIC